MSAPRPSFALLRFAPAVAVDPTVTVMELAREDGLALLDWLGLGRPDFGAVSARELAPRCRRRLWPVDRNADEALRRRTGELLAVAEAAGEGMVFFG